MPDNVLPTRSELEKVIEAFDSNHPDYEDYGFDNDKLRSYAERRKMRGFSWSQKKERNPYRNACDLFSDAFHDYLKKQGIASMEVCSAHHDYLLVPVQENGAVAILVFDPTAEQFYEKCAKTYFLGTPEELFQFYQQKLAAGHFHTLRPGVSFKDTYSKDLDIRIGPHIELHKGEIFQCLNRRLNWDYLSDTQFDEEMKRRCAEASRTASVSFNATPDISAGAANHVPPSIALQKPSTPSDPNTPSP